MLVCGRVWRLLVEGGWRLTVQTVGDRVFVFVRDSHSAFGFARDRYHLSYIYQINYIHTPYSRHILHRRTADVFVYSYTTRLSPPSARALSRR